MAKFVVFSFLSIFTLLQSPVTRAEFVQNELYVGASAGISIFDKLNTTDIAYKIYGGYLLYDYVGLDIAYLNLGKPEANNVTTKTTGFSVSGIGNLPVTDQVSLFAKIGTFIWDVSPSTGKSTSGNDYNVGFGVNFNTVNNLYLHGELERYKIGKEVAIIYSLGLALGF